MPFSTRSGAGGRPGACGGPWGVAFDERVPGEAGSTVVVAEWVKRMKRGLSEGEFLAVVREERRHLRTGRPGLRINRLKKRGWHPNLAVPHRRPLPHPGHWFAGSIPLCRAPMGSSTTYPAAWSLSALLRGSLKVPIAVSSLICTPR